MWLASVKSEPVYLWEMMRRLGIEADVGVLPRWSLSYATALHRCQSCPSKQVCREWLDSTPAPAAFAPAFCPSADILFELQVDQFHEQDQHALTRWHG
jgi:Family of unknown function (DUF6455)